MVESIEAPREEHLARLETAFHEAVMRSLAGSRSLALSLSSGLDSNSIASILGPAACSSGASIAALTWTAGGRPIAPGLIGDESDVAVRAADWFGMPVEVVDSRIGVIQAIRTLARETREPVHTAANTHTLLATAQRAGELGCDVLVTGSHGNHTLSWEGIPRLRRKSALRQRAIAVAPAVLRDRVRRRRSINMTTSAMRSDLAHEVHMPAPAGRSPSEARWAAIARAAAGASVYTTLHAARSWPIYVSPLVDEDLVEACFATPDEAWRDPATGESRWIIREMMRTRLPPEVLNPTRRGVQGADIVARLREQPGDVEDVLRELAGGPAEEYLDVDKMREVWSEVLRSDALITWRRAARVLCFGALVGLVINDM